MTTALLDAPTTLALLKCLETPKARKTFQEFLEEIALRPLDADDERSLTPAQFRAVEGDMSKSTYHKLKSKGLGPEETHFPEMQFTLITPTARREWHEKIARYRETQAAQLEADRRALSAQVAGRVAAQSPDHVSHRKKVKQRRKK